ncbi:MAG: right-handed parallel beta-helix repeat-containing protein [Thermomicrobiales bacterium]
MESYRWLQNKDVWARLAAVALVVTLVLVLIATLSRRMAAAPVVRLGESTASAGSTLTAIGWGFPPEAEGALVWVDGSVLATFPTDSAGALFATVTIPHVPRGSYVITARVTADSHADRPISASVSLEVKPAGDDTRPPEPAGSFDPSAIATTGGDCPTTMQALVDAAAAGAVIKVPPCVYRETVTIAKPLTLDGQGLAELRGSDVWTGWTESDGYWVRGTLPPFTIAGVCQAGTSRCQWPAQVFVDGRPLTQVAANPTSGQFAVDSARRVVLADEPTGQVVEVTTRERWIIGAAGDVTIRGFRMRHAATPYQEGAIWNGPEHDNWVVAGNMLSDAHGANIRLTGIGHQLIDNDISRGGILGVSLGGDDMLIHGNHLHHNNTEGADPFWEAGGLKGTRGDRIIVDGNRSDHNDGPGIWCDYDCHDWVISNNRVHHNRANGGILYEMGRGGRIFGNAVWENGWGHPDWVSSAGILLANSSHTEVYANTVAWNADGIAITATDRFPEWNAVMGNYVHGNVIVAADDGHTLAWVEGGGLASVLFVPASYNRGAHNRYWYPEPDRADSRFQWDGEVAGLAEFNATAGEEQGVYLSVADMARVLTDADIPLAPERR